MPSLDPSAIDALPHHRPETILAHSRFGEARGLFVEGILGLYEHDTFLTRLLTQAARSVVFFTIVCLHFAHDEANRDTWPTMSLLQATVGHFGLSSPRRVQDIVGRLVQTGYLASSPAELDRRARILRPSPKMLAHDLDWLAAYYRPLDALFPDPGYGPPLRRDPEFQRAQRVVGLAMSLYSARLLAANPAFMLFLGRDAGAMILIKLVQLSRSEEGPDRAPHFVRRLRQAVRHLAHPCSGIAARRRAGGTGAPGRRRRGAESAARGGLRPLRRRHVGGARAVLQGGDATA